MKENSWRKKISNGLESMKKQNRIGKREKNGIKNENKTRTKNRRKSIKKKRWKVIKRNRWIEKQENASSKWFWIKNKKTALYSQIKRKKETSVKEKKAFKKEIIKIAEERYKNINS